MKMLTEQLSQKWKEIFTLFEEAKEPKENFSIFLHE